MKKYQVVYSKKAAKQLKKFDKSVSHLIVGWIEKNLIGTSNPCQHGKALSENLAGVWRYRVGDYRILAEILNDEIIIIVLSVGHRKEIY